MQSAFPTGSGSFQQQQQQQQQQQSTSALIEDHNRITHPWPEPDFSGPGISVQPTLNSHQMGQGASTPRADEGGNNTTSDRSSDAARIARDGAGSSSAVAGDGRAPTRLRRSRRLQGHFDRLNGIRERWMPSEPNPLTRSRLSRLRPRRERHVDGSRSPSPRILLRQELAERRRTMPAISRPIPLDLPSPAQTTFAGDSGLEMMDISPVTSQVAPPPPPPPQQPQQPQQRLLEEQTETAGLRRTRMSRLRNSVSSWSELLGRTGRSGRTPMGSRRNSVMDPSAETTPMDIDAPATRLPARPTLQESSGSTSASGDSATTRSERPSLFNPNVLEGLGDSTRARPGEDQAAMLSRLLSVAAAATAASLVGNADQAITEAQDVGGDNGGDGSFEAFLRALQNGRLEAALRNGGSEMGGGTPGDGNEPQNQGVMSLNYFRMFRFGTQPAAPASESGDDGQPPPQRMVPVIIVGIRSVPPRDANDTGEESQRHSIPFFDALANFPMPLSSAGSSGSLGSRNRTPRDHRRTASLGTTGSTTTEANPFSNLRRGSTDTTPAAPSRTSAVIADALAAFRRESASRRSTGSETANATNEDAGSSAQLRPPRRFSASDSRPRANSTGSGRRAPGEGTRSWIIYVLGASYPENHPILTTPSLFTDEPTFEDMTLLSSILGPAKPPVAAQSDLESAGGTFVFGAEDCPIDPNLWKNDRCLVCLCDYEQGEEGRQLAECRHMFHKECIDQWLTTGRNSCPLCRRQGVEEKKEAAAAGEGSGSGSAPAGGTTEETPQIGTAF